MSSIEKNMRITELESTVAALLARVKQLEAMIAVASSPSPTPPTSPERANETPIAAFAQKPLHHPVPTPPPTLPTKPKEEFILYDVNVQRPNGAKRVHRKFIQTLHAAGVPKEDICQRTLDEFPDLCTGGSEKARHARVWNEVEMSTSRWAERYV